MIGFLINAIKVVFLLGFLILIHEGGHFLVAKLCKVNVIEFSIGFGPIILKKQRKQTQYSLRLIPLGGFVNLEGEEEHSEVEGSFSKASIPKRMAIVIAGGLTNIVFAILSFFILALSIAYISKYNSTFNDNLYFAIIKTKEFIFSMFQGLKMIFTGRVEINQFMGPVGISEVVAKTSGIQDYVYMLSSVSLSLGVTNLLPLPALDGGKLLLLIIEGIRRKKLSEKTEINIQLIGFTLLIMLSIYVAYNDILRIIGK